MTNDPCLEDQLVEDSPGHDLVDIAADESEDLAEPEDFATMLEEYSQASPEISRGAIIRGQIVKIDGENCFVDLGGKSEGILDARELVNSDGEIAYAIGDEVEATVVGFERDGGAVQLSRSLVKSARSKEAIREAYENRLTVEGHVTGRNKGGFEVTVAGQQAFVPMSQMDMARTDDLDQYLNQTFQFRIMEIKNGGRDIVLSRAALQREEAAAKAEVLRESLKEGDVLTGVVKNIRDFGAFVDIGGMEGLLHVSELSWGRVSHPRDVVQEGEQVTVQVIKFDRETDRVSLSMKHGPSPWEDVGTRFVETGVYPGIVRRLEPFGAFVELVPGLEGLLHVSNISWSKRIQHPRDVLTVGQEITVQLLNIDLDRKRLGLGMKQVEGDPWDGLEETLAQDTLIEGTVDKVANFGIFLRLESGITGLIPNSEMGTPRDANHAAMFPVGTPIKVRVLEVNTVDRRLSLSRKNALDAGEKESFKAYKQSRASRSATTSQTGGSESKGLGTFGDLLGGLKLKK